MPTLTKGDKILVSGASGFIGIWAVRSLLENGYRVRGTVRSDTKGKFLSKMFASYGENFEYVIVDDISPDGAFDEAVRGVDAINHTAGPFVVDADTADPQDLIVPAVKGTVGILESAKKHGTSIKRIVLTSSVVAISELGPDAEKLFTEDNWNEQSIQMVEQLGKNAPGPLKYFASKTLAEKAAWKFYEENKSELSWELVVLCPGFVFGPIIHEVTTVESLNASSAFWYKTVFTDEVLEVTKMRWTWLDVRDLAQGYILSLQKEAAGGERIILAAGEFLYQDWVTIANELPPTEITSRISKPKTIETTYAMRMDASKADRILGIKYRDMKETAKDMLAYFESRGW